MLSLFSFGAFFLSRATTMSEKFVLDEDLIQSLDALLSQSDLSNITVSAIRQQLEQQLQTDLSEKHVVIQEHVDHYLKKKTQNQVNDEAPGKQKVEELNEETNVKVLPVQQVEEPGHGRENVQPTIEQSLPKEKRKRGGPGGLNKVCKLSPGLQAIVGAEVLPRTEVVRQLWVYIRAHNLQDPENKRQILCNDALRELFGTDSTDMFYMNKLLSKHIWSAEKAEGCGDSEPKPKKPKAEKEGSKGKAPAFLSPLPISESLQKFLGTGETEVSRGEAVKSLWVYIRENNLQDPSDKKKILCDGKLQELLGCDNFVGETMTTLLAPHFQQSTGA